MIITFLIWKSYYLFAMICSEGSIMIKTKTDLDIYKDNFYEYRKRLNKLHPLRSLFFEMTLRCNARCEHCGSSCGDVIQKDEITKEEIFKVLEDIKNAGIYNPRTVMLNITGGEPLLRQDLFEIMNYANKLGFDWGMVTNGVLISEKNIKKMMKTGMKTISISLDGMANTHESFRHLPKGSFDKTNIIQ